MPKTKPTADRFLIATLCLAKIEEAGCALSPLILAGKIGYSYPVVKQALDQHGVELGLIPRKGSFGKGTDWGLTKAEKPKPKTPKPAPPDMMDTYRAREESESARRLRESLERFRRERAMEGRHA